MTPNEYQNLASRTLLNKPEVYPSSSEIMLVWNTTGLSGEVGELCEMIKKVIFHRHPLTDELRMKMSKEIGDIMWYVAAICTKLDLSLETVMNDNIEKLKERYPDGFTSKDSINRKEALYGR